MTAYKYYKLIKQYNIMIQSNEDVYKIKEELSSICRQMSLNKEIERFDSSQSTVDIVKRLNHILYKLDHLDILKPEDYKKTYCCYILGIIPIII